jgi:hypothetical protein
MENGRFIKKDMKKEVWIIIVCLSAVESSLWANNATQWNRGGLVFRNGVEWEGELNFNWIAQVVQCRQGGTIKAYAANQIQSFTYYDNQQDIIRKFVSLDCSTKHGRQRPRIVEEVFLGCLPVYRELYLSHGLIKVVNLTGYNPTNERVKDTNNFTYMVYFGGKLLPLLQFYRQIWPNIKRPFHKELTQYALRSNTDLARTAGQLQLIHKYNSIIERNRLTLSEQNTLSTGL